MQQDGFVDLRLNNAASGEESFWPTFTDIMMVIVLIFLLAMLTLLVKNMDLVDQLRASLQSERMATAQVQSTTDKNTELNLRLRQLEAESAMLRMRLMDLGEEHGRSLTQLEAGEAANRELKSRLSEMRQKYALSEEEKTVLETQLAQLQTVLDERSAALADEQHQYRLAQAEINQMKLAQGTQLDRLKSLESEYASLEIKYNRLIRPARSQLGKEVVLVRYHKQDGQLGIEMKGSKDAHYVPVTGVVLHKRLSALQQQYGKKLYVRIIFPDDSGLSYTEAWNLTESLLRMYDYYYQE